MTKGPQLVLKRAGRRDSRFDNSPLVARDVPIAFCPPLKDGENRSAVHSLNSLQLAAALLHILGGILAYALCKPMGYDEQTSRTFAIETSMKSSAFGFLLAKLHFADFLVRVPAAVRYGLGS